MRYKWLKKTDKQKQNEPRTSILGKSNSPIFFIPFLAIKHVAENRFWPSFSEFRPVLLFFEGGAEFVIFPICLLLLGCWKGVGDVCVVDWYHISAIFPFESAAPLNHIHIRIHVIAFSSPPATRYSPLSTRHDAMSLANTTGLAVARNSC